jgi:hypothetical protein
MKLAQLLLQTAVAKVELSLYKVLGLKVLRVLIAQMEHPHQQVN